MLLRFGFILGLLFTINQAFAQATYSYQGNTFDFFDPPFTASSQITGSIEVGQFLAPNSSLDLTGTIQSYSFTDGQNTRNQSNSTLCQFDVSTDASGSIASWSIYIRQTDTAPTENQHTIDLLVGAVPEELSGFGSGVGGTGCNGIALGNTGSSATAPANAWSGGPPVEAQSVPTLSIYMMMLLGLLVICVSTRYSKKTS